MSQKGPLEIADIRSVAHPLGMSPARSKPCRPRRHVESPRGPSCTSGPSSIMWDKENGPHVTRLDLVLSIDPFSRQSIEVLDRIEDAIRTSFPERLAKNSELYPIGPTASVRDLRTGGQPRSAVD